MNIKSALTIAALAAALIACTTDEPAAEDSASSDVATADSSAAGDGIAVDTGRTDAIPSDTPATDSIVADTAQPPADAADTGPPAVLALRAALKDPCPSGGNPKQPYPNALKPGDDLHKVTLSDPDALCNDGTPAVLYIRAALTPQNANRWVFYTQGGGGCSSYEECRARFCGNQGIYDASKMSSGFTPESVGGAGIMFNDATNPFNDANHVYVYYCSSDQWTGRKSNTVMTSEDGTMSFSIHFRGHSILDAMMDRLMTAGGVTSDDAVEAVPNLSDATDVLWTGVSAGAAGAAHNTDWFAGHFDAAKTKVRAVFDANSGPELDAYTADVSAAFLEKAEQRWTEQWVPFFDAYVDESCAAHAENQGPNTWKCSDTIYTKLNHITTPFFQRQDLRDPVASGGPISLGATRAEFADGTITTLEKMAAIKDDALEAAAIDFTPGTYGPSCKQHVAITNNAFFLQTTVEDGGGIGRSFGEALDLWLSGETVELIDTRPPTKSVCTDPTDNLS